MPLHKIPLCSFKYVGDNTLSSGAFVYDTTWKVLKTKEKLFYKDKVIEINKSIGDKLLYKNFYNIGKNNNKYFYKENSIEDKNINIKVDKNLLDIRNTQLNKNNIILNLYIDKENLQLDKSKTVYTDGIAKKEIFKDNIIKNFKLGKNINFEKYYNCYLARIYFKEINTNELKFIKRNKSKNIDKDTCFFIDRFNLEEIIGNGLKILKKNIMENINAYRNISNLNLIDIKSIDKNYNSRLMYISLPKNIGKYKYTDFLDKVNIKSIDKHDNKIYFYREKTKMLCKHDNRCLDRKVIATILKEDKGYLDYTSLINIYKQIEKGLLDLTIWSIYKEHDKNLKGTIIKDVYEARTNIKFIEVTKRWWWLRPTYPADELIIPNKDFNYNTDLLNNADYEYLRFNNHPIEWGKDWGIDYNIPPIGISIEIMLDLINILMMIWHKNTQAWLSCTGKESIQFIMELVYDWYTLDTSNPNTDYIRAYRWIRWEAEKVYFCDVKNGLQAIGLLIANLIGYMKQHHFNLVPIWYNPKAMDIEREFNKVATNGDIIKNLDKLKGKRRYYIETQNFEKEKIFGG